MKQLQELDNFTLSRRDKIWTLSIYNEKNRVDCSIESKSLGDILTQLDKLKALKEEQKKVPIIINNKKIKHNK